MHRSKHRSSSRGPWALLVAALVITTGALSLVGVLPGPVNLAAGAAPDTTRQRLAQQLANCRNALAVATSRAEREWASNCVRLTKRALDGSQPGSTPTAPAIPPPPTATPTGPATPTSPGTPTSPATPAPTTSSPTQPPAPPPPVPSANPAGWPNAASTGVPAGTALTVHSSTTVTTAGTVIDGWDIHGYLEIKAANVTVRNTRVRCDASGACEHTMASGLRMSRVDIGPDSGYGGIAIMDGGSSSAGASRNIYSGINIHNVGDGLRCDGGFTLQDSWVHNLELGNGVHSDACQATAGGSMVFRHNVIEGGNTSCFLIQSNPSGVLIEDNLLLGVHGSGEQTSYATNVGPSVPQGGVVFRNNVINYDWQSGVDGSSSVYQWNSTTWSGNTHTDGKAIPAP
jgi:hypothetical protein